MSVALDFTKDPDAKLDFPIDWSGWLGSDSITASLWSVPAGLTLESEVFAPAETTAWLSGGTDGAVYVVTNRITTTAGRVNEASIRLKVVSEESSLAPIDLVVLTNSFQSYADAMLLSREMSGLAAWSAASDIDRSKALIDAFERLIRVGYRVPRPDSDLQSRFDANYATEISPRHWDIVTLPEFEALPARFLRALKKAQVAEAEVILGGDLISGRRRAGLLSETVGESSMMFRPGKPLQLGVSEQALVYLTGFVNLRMTMVRS
jgi:hypothetical protein